MRRIENCSRRGFLRGLTGVGGLILGVCVRPREALAGAPARAVPARLRPGVFLAIAADGLVTIVAHRSEMGTGIRTSLPMVVADELGADWGRVRVEQAPASNDHGSQDTDGSRSVREFFHVMREAGATARAMLEKAAALRWGVEAAGCEARDHRVHHRSTGRSLPFADLVSRAAGLPVPRRDSLRLRKISEYRTVGGDVRIVDSRRIVTGKATFGMDVRLDGMRYAAIARPPVLGARVRSNDASACLAVRGVERVVALDPASPPYGNKALGGIAVIARDTWAAFQGRSKLQIFWDRGAGAGLDSDVLRGELVALVEKPARVVRSKGDVDAGFARASHVHEAVYYLPHLAHAPMEPPVATAHVRSGRCEVWAPTQNPQGARAEVARALGIPEGEVIVHVTLLGGGFGRKSFSDFIVEAALLSREVGAPVKVVWSREDDIRHDYYHTVAAVKMKASVDARGRPVAWLQRTAFPPIPSTFRAGHVDPSAGELGMGFVDLPFDIESLRCEAAGVAAPVRIGWLRSVCNIFHAFAIGSFAGELAALARRDALEYLLELIGPPRRVDVRVEGAEYNNMGASLEDYPIDTGRLRRVTEIAAKNAGWGRPLPRGRGLGIACHRSFQSYVATVVEVDVSRDGRLSVPRVDVVIDCGLAVNPDRVRAQMEGAAVFATSLALTGEITVKGGAVVQGNFNDYRVARINDAPAQIRVHIVPSEAPPAGVGEPGVPPFGPALANAIHAATGKRVRSLPLSHHDLRWG